MNKGETLMETEKNSTFFFRFEDLRIYHKSLDYASWIYNQSQQFPENEKGGLWGRFNRAAQSIAVNIAEGSGRNKLQFIYYLKLAKSAIRECIVLTTIAGKINLFAEENEQISRGYLIELTKMIGALTSSLQRTTKESDLHEVEENDEDAFNRL